MSEDTLIPVLQDYIDFNAQCTADRARYTQLKKCILNLAPETKEHNYVLLRHKNIICKVTKQQQHIWNTEKLVTACNFIGYETFKTLFDINFTVKSIENINALLSNQGIDERFKQMLQQAVIPSTTKSLINISLVDKQNEPVIEQPLPIKFGDLIEEACHLRDKMYWADKKCNISKTKIDGLLSKVSASWHNSDNCSVVYNKFLCTKTSNTFISCDEKLVYALYLFTDKVVFNNIFNYRFKQRNQYIDKWLADYTVSNELKNLVLDAKEGTKYQYGLAFMTITDID